MTPNSLQAFDDTHETRPPVGSRLDHITIAALTLEQGVEHVRRCLGVVVPPGQGHIRVWYTPRYFWLAAAASVVAVLITAFVLASGTSRLGVTK